MTEAQLRLIFGKTDRHCHFCGDRLAFMRRGWTEKPDGHWEVDHVIQRHKGGVNEAANYLPACTRCNRLRWHRTGEQMRELLGLGIVASREVRLGTAISQSLVRKNQARKAQNALRRGHREG